MPSPLWQLFRKGHIYFLGNSSQWHFPHRTVAGCWLCRMRLSELKHASGRTHKTKNAFTTTEGAKHLVHVLVFTKWNALHVLNGTDFTLKVHLAFCFTLFSMATGIFKSHVACISRCQVVSITQSYSRTPFYSLKPPLTYSDHISPDSPAIAKPSGFPLLLNAGSLTCHISACWNFE